MATIYIDDKPYEVKDGQNLLEACISLGLNVPYFCWHPALGSVGACRQCAVKQFANDQDTRGRVVMSCMTPASEGTRISVADKDSKEFRASVIEWMMTNHPHDCPVCDEGGECHLQDMTLMTGHNYREYRFDKRTFRNQDLGPFINHEMNRCIQCYRCVRYYRDYAGGRDLNAFSSHNHTYFGRHEDGTLESEFSGNLVEVCPTGVFTDKTLKEHYTRRWDLTTAPSVCVHCALGCNITPGERYGKLRRVRNRYSLEVNGYFLCDRGRYGYEFVNDAKRPTQPLLRDVHGALQPAGLDEAVKHAANLILDGKRAIGIGSPRASLESNYSLLSLVGKENFFHGVNRTDAAATQAVLGVLQAPPAHVPGLGEIESYDAVLVLGEDLTNVAPVAALNVRQTVHNQPYAVAAKMGIPAWNDFAVREAIGHDKGPLYLATPHADKLDDVARVSLRAAPDDIARLGFAVAAALDANAPAPANLNDDTQALATEIAQALKAAKKPLVIAGASLRNVGIVQAAANVARALARQNTAAGLYYTALECNATGHAMLEGGALEDAAALLQSGEADVVFVMENDLFRRATTPEVEQLLAAAKHVVVMDHTLTATAEHAELVLPAATFAEGDGTLVNNLGRAQRMTQVYPGQGEIRESWHWTRRIRMACGRGTFEEWGTLDHLLAAMVRDTPALAKVLDVSPNSSFRVGGQRIPRQSHRYSGRTAIKANVSVSETPIIADDDSPMAFSMEGFQRLTPAKLMSSFWLPGWNSAQAITRFQEEVNGPLEGGDPGVRIIAPKPQADGPYFNVPEAAAIPAGLFLATPRYHIFGSEELSVKSDAVREVAPSPYAALHPDDAAALGIAEGDSVAVRIGANAYVFNAVLDDSLPKGVAAVPVGLPGLPFMDLPQVAQLSREHAA